VTLHFRVENRSNYRSLFRMRREENRTNGRPLVRTRKNIPFEPLADV
jgi:hypothetical protein